MKEISGYQFDGNPLTARAYLFAGLGNRWLAENFCYVVFSSPYEGDTGEAQPKSAGFQRAIGHYEKALQHAGSGEIATAAKGGLAQAYVGLGDWTQAATYAAQVPTDFVYYAIYSENSSRESNQIYFETHRRAEMSVYYTFIETLGPEGDPRVPWKDCSTPGICEGGHQGAGDENNPHYQQMKYPELGSDIPVIKGTEMRLIEAEALLRDNQVGPAVAKINEARAFHGLGPLTAMGIGTGFTYDWDSMLAWDILDREYLVTNWLEGRRLFQFHRWKHQDGWTHPYLTGKHHFYELVVPERFTCYPIADSECQVNEKVKDLCI